MTENSGSGSEAGGGDQGAGQAAADSGKGQEAQVASVGKEGAAKSAPAVAEAKSLRASMSELLGDTERPDFEKWSSGYTTDKDFAVAAVNLRKTYDARVPVPGKDAKPEEMAKYFSRVGMPKSPGDYKFDFGSVEIGDHDKARFEEFRQYAFDNFYTQPQFEKAVGFYTDTNVKQTEVKLGMAEQFQKSTVDTLKKEWGVDYDENLMFARDAGSQFAGDEEWKAFADTRLENGMFAGDHPTVMKMMAKIGRGINEDTRARMVMKGSEVEGYQAQIAAIEKEAFEKKSSTYQEPYASQLEVLYKKLYPGKRKV
jgi:hypothetical protein